MNSRRRRLKGAFSMFAATAAFIALAGCTAIPTSGTVHAGGQTGADENAAQVRVPAQKPVSGEAPDQIVDGFRQASADAADLSIARAYLVQPNWEPKGMRVIDEPVAPSLSSSGDRAKVHFIDKWLGTIAPDGTYQPAHEGSTIDYTYELVEKVKGEWRIANPPDYSIATVSAVNDFYDQNFVYFLSPRSRLLVPVRVFLPAVSDKATELASALLQGPPAWLQQAGVVTAIPPETTLKDAVSQSDGVVTVNLSAEFAALNATERDAASAQIVYTLQHFGDGEFKIEAAGQPLPGGLQSTKTLSAYDSDALRVDSFYYAGTDGRTYASSGFPVAGDAGSGAVKLDTPVVAPRIPGTTGPPLVAGVVKGDSSQTLYVGPLSSPKPVQYAASFTTPSWDAFGNVWTVVQSSANSPQQVLVSAVTQAGTTKFMTVDDPELADSQLIESLKVSRDGTRVAVVARSATSGPQVLIGHVEKTANGQAIGGFYPVAPALVPLPDGITWSSASTLDVLATAPGSTNATVWTVDVDGWQETQVTTLPFGLDVVSFASAPGRPLVIETRGHQIEVYRNNTWEVVGDGTNPSYPG